MARMNVSFDDSLLEEVRRWVPRRQRSRFISDAVQVRLDQLKQERAIRAAAGLWSSDGRGDPDEEIRLQRSRWGERLKRLEGQGG